LMSVRRSTLRASPVITLTMPSVTRMPPLTNVHRPARPGGSNANHGLHHHTDDTTQASSATIGRCEGRRQPLGRAGCEQLPSSGVESTCCQHTSAARRPTRSCTWPIGTVRILHNKQNLHWMMTLVPTPSSERAWDQWHSSRESAALNPRHHCSCRNSEGTVRCASWLGWIQLMTRTLHKGCRRWIR
jgi:hypothetical protein